MSFLICIGCGDNNHDESHTNNSQNNLNSNFNNDTSNNNILNNEHNKNDAINENNNKTNNTNTENVQNTNINNNITENQNNINLENNITNSNDENNLTFDANHCLSPDDFEQNWIRKPGYLSRTACSGSNAHMIFGSRDILSPPSKNLCPNQECSLPDYSTEYEGYKIIHKVTATIGNIDILEGEELRANSFSVCLEYLDLSNSYKVGQFCIGNMFHAMTAHIPNIDSFTGRKMTLIEVTVVLPIDSGLEFTTPFILDSETGDLIFGSVVLDNYLNAGNFYDSYLNNISYKGNYKYKNMNDICSEAGSQMKYFAQSDCATLESGDILFTTDSGEFIVPSLSEGDIELNSKSYGVVTSYADKYTKNTCNPGNELEHEEFEFYIFDREFFISNPDFAPLNPQCND